MVYLVMCWKWQLYKSLVRKISKCKMEDYKASLVNKLLRVSCMTGAQFFFIQQCETFGKKHHV